ncbi:uncharacterized protein BT62DRAFT_1012934 [Guyanagaster necrorhizus]|uniref:Uncharacterized protein n=1 Tax=Guyanagaster necrorhizus TaxID=856835 RepID=A0A9P7VG17_9AGAR|nr:uncharacterized protein BT62DRAFT_1012934 [Guyanagaster necrorhizus MCA 3950]KAG7440278.1 hypothetical protein BT62DRAFT_1012934 [Guyanagaster necrorhizus MCA 3950]
MLILVLAMRFARKNPDEDIGARRNCMALLPVGPELLDPIKAKPAILSVAPVSARRYWAAEMELIAIYLAVLNYSDEAILNAGEDYVSLLSCSYNNFEQLAAQYVPVARSLISRLMDQLSQKFY